MSESDLIEDRIIEPGAGTNFIDPRWIKTSEYPKNFLPVGSIAIDQTSENGDCTVKGFYDPKTGEYHIQEVVYNQKTSGPT